MAFKQLESVLVCYDIYEVIWAEFEQLSSVVVSYDIYKVIWAEFEQLRSVLVSYYISGRSLNNWQVFL